MSKHLKKKNLLAPSSDEEKLADPVAATAAGSTKGPCKDVEVEPFSSPAAEDGWKRLAEQIDSLQAVLWNLVTLIASSTASGPAGEMPPSGNGLGGSRSGVAEERAATCGWMGHFARDCRSHPRPLSSPVPPPSGSSTGSDRIPGQAS
ncbi:unnamed protein product [Lampetra planeri]